MILNFNKETILIVIIHHHFESGMLKILEFYMLCFYLL